MPGSKPSTSLQKTPRLVIVGAGFGGVSLAKRLSSCAIEILLIDRHNYHLFQPLLYQVATAGLSPGDICWPIRSLFRRQRNLQVLMDRVESIDRDNKTIHTASRSIQYDFLALACGLGNSYFGNDWADVAPGLKSLDDAIEIRRRILLAFEQAESETDEARRQGLLSFVIVGGGPTGIELAGALAELAHRTLAADFRNIEPRETRVLLVEAGPHILTSFDQRLSEAALRSLQSLGVEVKTGQAIEDCDDQGVMLGGKRVAAHTVLWAAGVEAETLAASLGAETDNRGRIIVEPDFSIAGDADAFVIGDAASYRIDERTFLPGIAPAAKQAGHYVGTLLEARIHGKASTRPFRYRDYGNLATVGRKSAIIDLGWLRLQGWLAWWLWGITHIYFLVGVRNRLLVMIQWFWSYLTFERGARIISGDRNEYRRRGPFAADGDDQRQ